MSCFIATALFNSKARRLVNLFLANLRYLRSVAVSWAGFVLSEILATF